MYSLNPLKVRQPRRLFLSSSTGRFSSLSTPPFIELVVNLKKTNKTCTVIESSCGGLISSSLMAVPGSSKVYWGGTIAYNTKKSGKLLVSGDDRLHNRLLDASSTARNICDNDIEEEERGIHIPRDFSEEAKHYIRSKVISTSETALSYCREMETDFAIAEGGATGPTFRPEGMNKGFAVLTIAGRKQDGVVDILAQRLCLSTNADRQLNMRLFADASADLCLEAISIADQSSETTKPILQQQQIQIESLDRSSQIRDDGAIMKDLYNRLDSVHVLLRGTNEVMFATNTDLALPTLKDITEDKSLIALFNTGGGDATTQEDILKKRTFIGRIGEHQTPVFATFLPNDATYDGSYQSCYFANTRSRAPLLNSLHNELASTSTAYVNWQNTHQFCCTCGAPLKFIHGRTCAKCMGSDKTHFHWPRQDPSIIFLVTNPAKTHALLARSPRHKPYLYTCLAGFVEAGETFESAGKSVMREVYEEVGVNVDKDSISYIASQPWPFPRSTMIGMHARSSLDVDMAPISIDPKEIVDAQWFDKETVYQAAKHSDEIGAVLDPKVVEAKQTKGWNGKLLVPSKGVLARKLVDHWLDDD